MRRPMSQIWRLSSLIGGELKNASMSAFELLEVTGVAGPGALAPLPAPPPKQVIRHPQSVSQSSGRDREHFSGWRVSCKAPQWLANITRAFHNTFREQPRIRAEYLPNARN